MKQPWKKTFDRIEQNIKNITDEVNDYLLFYFKNSFNIKSFDNKPWKPSKHNQDTLVDSGDLKKSIKTVSKSIKEIHIQSATPYSAIHNYGGTIRITDKMRKFFWAKFYETKKKHWKFMALSKKTFIYIPQRQYMGTTVKLKKEVEQIIKKIITK